MLTRVMPVSECSYMYFKLFFFFFDTFYAAEHTIIFQNFSFTGVAPSFGNWLICPQLPGKLLRLTRLLANPGRPVAMYICRSIQNVCIMTVCTCIVSYFFLFQYLWRYTWAIIYTFNSKQMYKCLYMCSNLFQVFLLLFFLFQMYMLHYRFNSKCMYKCSYMLFKLSFSFWMYKQVATFVLCTYIQVYECSYTHF